MSSLITLTAPAAVMMSSFCFHSTLSAFRKPPCFKRAVTFPFKVKSLLLIFISAASAFTRISSPLLRYRVPSRFFAWIRSSFIWMASPTFISQRRLPFSSRCRTVSCTAALGPVASGGLDGSVGSGTLAPQNSQANTRNRASSPAAMASIVFLFFTSKVLLYI